MNRGVTALKILRGSQRFPEVILRIKFLIRNGQEVPLLFITFLVLCTKS